MKKEIFLMFHQVLVQVGAGFAFYQIVVWILPQNPLPHCYIAAIHHDGTKIFYVL